MFLFFLIIISAMLISKYKSDKELEIVVKINGGIPFKWEYEIEDTTVCELVKIYEKDNENKGAIVGGTIHYGYVFKGLKEGKTTIILKYVSIDGDRVVKQERYNVKVDENANISIVS